MVKKIFAVMAIILTVVICGCGGGGGGAPGASSNSTVTVTNGTVSGVVTSDGIHPISDVSVTDNTGAYTTTTNSTGNYTLSLPTGSKTLTYSASGYNGTIINVSVTSGGTSNYNITLKPPGSRSTGTLASITVTPANQSIAVGATQLFTATGRYSDNSTKELTSSVTWSSSSNSVTTMTGRVAIAVESGSSIITATSGVITGSSMLTVTASSTPATLRTVTTIAGWSGSSGSADGTGLAARFDLPCGITSDGSNLYITDSSNMTIRKLVISTGAVTTIAGLSGTSGSANGIGSTARFLSPSGITTDGSNLYVSDSINREIRKIVISTGEVSTIAGSKTSMESTDGTGSAASFYMPQGIVTDGTNLYVADYSTIRKIVISTGVVTTIAGSQGVLGSTDGTGSAALFNWPRGITMDGTNLYVADTYNHAIRKIVISTGAVTTIAGSADYPGLADGTGAAAQFHYPQEIIANGTNLYVASGGVRKIAISTGVVTTIAVGVSPIGITMSNGSLYTANGIFQTISKIQ